MENKDWINDYELLKQVSRANPYTAPDGYFDNLSDRIMSLKNIRTYTENTPGDGSRGTCCCLRPKAMLSAMLPGKKVPGLQYRMVTLRC